MEVGPDILREWIQAAISFVNKLIFMWFVRSIILLAKPHSLSYHAKTLVVLPMTCVCELSYIDECMFPLKSLLTNGNELMSNIPLSSLFAAFSISSLSSFIKPFRY